MKRIVNYLAEKNLHKWIGGYARRVVEQRVASLRDRKRARRREGPRHLLFAFCDHYEPLWGGATDAAGDVRVRAWSEGYPALAGRYRDADGHHPRHSFFFPGEQYRPRWLDALGGLAKKGFGEVELHLHHDGDTAETLRADILRYIGELASHGHLSRDPDGRLRYAFIHGNWALANGRGDGRRCGVDAEIPLLFDTGCYADFTFPAAPDECQPNIVNRIYWPTGDLSKKRSYERGEPARVGELHRDRILMIEGPLALATRKARLPVWIENSAITAKEPGTPRRIRTWVEQDIHVEGRPEWVFVKVHTHGAPDKQGASLLGDGGRTMHDELTTRYNDGKNWILHYVTAREMFNLAIAAMEGKSGNPAQYRDYVLKPPPVASASPRSAGATI